MEGGTMGQILHRSATTTEAVRRAIQHSQESLRSLSRRHGINQKTVAKWRRRDSTADRRTGPTVPRSTVLSVEQEAVIVAFRKHTLLPLDDRSLPRSTRRSRSLSHPHCAHRQRNPVRRSAEESWRAYGQMAWTSLRSHLSSSWHRPPSDPTQPSLDQRTGRTHEPHHQGTHRQTLLL